MGRRAWAPLQQCTDTLLYLSHVLNCQSEAGLVPWFSKCGIQTNSISTTWETIKNANFWVSYQINCMRTLQCSRRLSFCRLRYAMFYHDWSNLAIQGNVWKIWWHSSHRMTAKADKIFYLAISSAQYDRNTCMLNVCSHFFRPKEPIHPRWFQKNFLCLVNKYSLNTWYGPNTVLCTEDVV